MDILDEMTPDCFNKSIEEDSICDMVGTDFPVTVTLTVGMFETAASRQILEKVTDVLELNLQYLEWGDFIQTERSVTNIMYSVPDGKYNLIEFHFRINPHFISGEKVFNFLNSFMTIPTNSRARISFSSNPGGLLENSTTVEFESQDMEIIRLAHKFEYWGRRNDRVMHLTFKTLDKFCRLCHHMFRIPLGRTISFIHSYHHHADHGSITSKTNSKIKIKNEIFYTKLNKKTFDEVHDINFNDLKLRKNVNFSQFVSKEIDIYLSAAQRTSFSIWKAGTNGKKSPIIEKFIHKTETKEMRPCHKVTHSFFKHGSHSPVQVRTTIYMGEIESENPFDYIECMLTVVSPADEFRTIIEKMFKPVKTKASVCSINL